MRTLRVAQASVEEFAPRVRPAGDFFDIFPAEEEQVVWAAACEDFSVFHYCRGEPGLPVGAPSALWIR